LVATSPTPSAAACAAAARSFQASRASEQVAQRGQIVARRRAGQRDQPPRVLGQQRRRGARRIGFLKAVARPGEQPAQVLVAGRVLDQQQQGRGVRQRHLGADQRANPGPPGRPEEAGRAVDAVAIGQRQRVHPGGGRRVDQILGQRRAVEKAERRSTAQLDIVRGAAHGRILPERRFSLSRSRRNRRCRCSR
jgi:hypothetical protein